MPYCFFDTSALVKRYYEENGSEAVDAVIGDDDTTVVITSFAVIEAVSAVRRKYNTDEIAEDVMYSLIATFFREALADFVILPMEEIAFERSFDLVLQDDLRTLDALQLAAALSVATMICSSCVPTVNWWPSPINGDWRRSIRSSDTRGPATDP